MSERPGLATLAFLTLPPLMWASNAVVGRFTVSGGAPLASPIALNALRWMLALALLVLVVRPAARRERTAAPWKTYAALGLLSVTAYNTLQYLALRTSSAINVTLIAASGPVWMLLLGRFLFGERSRAAAWAGAALSLAGVLVVLTGGDTTRLARLRLEPGDLFMLAATLSWSLYSWLLRRNRPVAPASTFLLLQTAWGVALSVPLVAAEALAGDFVLHMEWRTAAVIAWVALGPSLLAYWCWDRGIARAGALLPAFFANLTPLFAALMSASLLGEPPQPFHAMAFALIVTGIVVSQRAPRPAPDKSA